VTTQFEEEEQTGESARETLVWYRSRISEKTFNEGVYREGKKALTPNILPPLKGSSRKPFEEGKRPVHTRQTEIEGMGQTQRSFKKRKKKKRKAEEREIRRGKNREETLRKCWLYTVISHWQEDYCREKAWVGKKGSLEEKTREEDQGEEGRSAPEYQAREKRRNGGEKLWTARGEKGRNLS